MRDHDVTALTAPELDRARRELAVSLTLARPGSPARVPILASIAAIDAELAGRSPAALLASSPSPACLACQMPDPPPDQTCILGRDHRVGTAYGCPTCGRLPAACASRPCSAMRGPGHD